MSSEDGGGRMLSCIEGIIVAGWCIVRMEARYHRMLELERESLIMLCAVFLQHNDTTTGTGGSEAIVSNKSNG